MFFRGFQFFQPILDLDRLITRQRFFTKPHAVVFFSNADRFGHSDGECELKRRLMRLPCKSLFGQDPLPYGLTPVNRRIIATLAVYLERQGFIDAVPDIDGLFAAG